MKNTPTNSFLGLCILISLSTATAQEITDSSAIFSRSDLMEDFKQFRSILENEHCCTYEYTSEEVLDSMFDAAYKKIQHPMTIFEYYGLLAPITAKIGCMHTSTWVPGRYFVIKPDKLFPLKVKFIDNYLVVTGSLHEPAEIPRGSILLHINGKPIEEIISDMRNTTPADALNPYFVDAQITKRFSMFYTSLYGLPDAFEVHYALPGRKTSETRKITPVSNETVRADVFSHFHQPLPEFTLLEDEQTCLLTIDTWIYYDSVDAFRERMDSCFLMLKEKKIPNLILDLRNNSGGDPWCAAALLSYLEKGPVPYFAESYRSYEQLSEPVPLAENNFTGNIYTLIDGSCGSTNGHFCALLDYHNIGTYIGTPSGATYKCNAGRNTELRLDHTQMIITIGRSTYSVAVEGMDKYMPIMPDISVKETYKDYLEGKDPWMEAALAQIQNRSTD